MNGERERIAKTIAAMVRADPAILEKALLEAMRHAVDLERIEIGFFLQALSAETGATLLERLQGKWNPPRQRCSNCIGGTVPAKDPRLLCMDCPICHGDGWVLA